MNDCRAGFSKALLRPSSSASTPISHSSTAPVTVSSPRISACTPIAACSSDHQPALVDAVGDHAAVGRQQQHRQRLQRDDQRRASVPSRVSVSTSHDCAVICIQVPISEIAWPEM